MNNPHASKAWQRGLVSLLTPPFRGCAIFLWLFFVIFSISCRNDGLWKGYLSDPDDYLYLVQAIDWLHGQNWFDAYQHRLNPPTGTYIHFSHLLSAFYAGSISLLQPFFGQVKAAWLTAVIIPPVYLGALFLLMIQLSRTFIHPKWGEVAVLLTFFFPGLLFQFHLGHLDHHGLEVVIATGAFFAIAKAVEDPASRRWPCLAAFLLTFGLYIGLEILPVVAALSLCFGLWVTFEGAKALKAGVYFGTSLLLSSFAFLLITRPPSHLFDIDIEAYSIVYVLLCGGVWLCYTGIALAGAQSVLRMRLAVAIVLTTLTAVIFLSFFPALRGGPYGKMNPELARLIFDAASEAWPVFYKYSPWERSAVAPIESIFALGAIFVLIKSSSLRSRKWIWAINGLTLFICLGLAVFYQRRFFSYLAPLASLPLAALIHYDWTHAPDTSKLKEHLRISRLAACLLIGPLSSLVIMHYPDRVVDPDDVSITPSRQGGPGCDMQAIAQTLNDPTTFGSHPHMIFNSLNEGIEILFRTPHVVLAAPYHMNVDGNLDTLHFFNAKDPNEAKEIALRRKGDLVFICNMPSQIFAYDLVDDNAEPSTMPLIQQLTHRHLPNWLKEIQNPAFGDAMLFEIDPTSGNPQN